MVQFPAAVTPASAQSTRCEIQQNTSVDVSHKKASVVTPKWRGKIDSFLITVPALDLEFCIMSSQKSEHAVGVGENNTSKCCLSVALKFVHQLL